MNAHELSDALGQIDLKYISGAMTYRRSAQPWVKWSAAAACFLVVLAAVWTNLPGALPGGPNMPVPAPMADPRTSQLPEKGTPPVDGTAEPYVYITATAEPAPTPPETEDPSHYLLQWEISMSSVPFNELGPQADAAKVWRDPERYEETDWDAETVRIYYGRDLTPAYVPPYLAPDPGNGTLRAIVSKETGEVVEDTFHLGFYEIYGTWEDGEPRTIGYDIPVPHGFNIAASKVGLITDCIYILPENEVKSTDIGGTAVTFGYRAMPYGPYDRETHTPSGYYDFVEADFTLDGTQYQLHFYQMNRSEVVKVVASLILGTRDIAITD